VLERRTRDEPARRHADRGPTDGNRRTIPPRRPRQPRLHQSGPEGPTFLVFFGYTHCPDVCPTTLFEVSEILRSLGPDADRLGALFITVDPERDTPERLKEYLSSFDPHLRGLIGDLASIKDVARGYRVYFKKAAAEGGEYTMDHSALVYLMDKEGRFVAPFNIKRTPEAAATDLRKYF
jgi:protein SCO1